MKRGQQQGQSVRSQKKTEKGNKMKHISVRTVEKKIQYIEESRHGVIWVEWDFSAE